jgi:hypothetical protein
MSDQVHAASLGRFRPCRRRLGGCVPAIRAVPAHRITGGTVYVDGGANIIA